MRCIVRIIQRIIEFKESPPVLKKHSENPVLIGYIRSDCLFCFPLVIFLLFRLCFLSWLFSLVHCFSPFPLQRENNDYKENSPAKISPKSFQACRAPCLLIISWLNSKQGFHSQAAYKTLRFIIAFKHPFCKPLLMFNRQCTRYVHKR